MQIGGHDRTVEERSGLRVATAQPLVINGNYVSRLVGRADLHLLRNMPVTRDEREFEWSGELSNVVVSRA